MFVTRDLTQHLHENKICINGFALSLALKQRLGATRKWPRETNIVHKKIFPAYNYLHRQVRFYF